MLKFAGVSIPHDTVGKNVLNFTHEGRHSGNGFSITIIRDINVEVAILEDSYPNN